MRRIQNTLLTALLLVGFQSFGQEKLDTTLVSATRVQTTLQESGKTILIITAQDIENMPVNTVEDLLQDLAGVNLNSRGGFGVQSDIGLRGSTFSQVLVMIDNQRLNDGLTGHFNNNIPIALTEIERIEVIKGPAGVAFGSDAVGGVIHIKTKTYLSKPSYKFNFGGKVAGGEYGLRNTDMGMFVNAKKWAFSGGLKTMKSDGPEYLNPNFGKNSVADSTYNAYFDLKNYTFSGVYFKNQWKVYLRGAADIREFDAKYFYTASSFDESEERINAYWLQSAIINEDSNQRTEFNIGYKHNQDTFAFLPTSVNGHTTTRLNSTITQSRQVRLFKLAYGAQYDQTTIESSDRGNHDNFSVAGFGQVQMSLSKHWLAMIGGRLEHNNQYGTYVIPQFTTTYRLPSITFRSSVGQSLRNPDFTERFVSYNIKQLAANRNVGNPDVKPEKSFSADLSADWRVNNKFKWTNTIFIRTSSNLIDYILTNSNTITNLGNLLPDTTYFYTQNISKSSTIGYEMSAQYDLFETDSSKLTFNIDYTLLETTNAGSEVSKYIANHPIHSVAPRLQFRYNRFRASISSNFITRNPEKIEGINGEVKNQYFLLNARVSYKPKYVPTQIFIEGRNILNTEYQEILGARMPGRWLYGGIVWRWGDLKR